MVQEVSKTAINVGAMNNFRICQSPSAGEGAGVKATGALFAAPETFSTT